MSSKALINTFAVIAIAESQCNIMMARLPEDDLEKILTDLIDCKQACGKAFGAWTGQIDKAGMRRLNSILDKFQASLHDMVVVEHTSTTLALLETLRSKIKDKTRKAALETLVEKFQLIHSFFDETGDLFDEYIKAEKIGKTWDNLFTD